MSNLASDCSCHDNVDVLVRLARIEERLVARDDAQETRDALMSATIREAVQDGLVGLTSRVDVLEKDIARGKIWVAASASVGGAAVWVVKTILPLLMSAIMIACGAGHVS